jgi:hypothetical protein
MLLLFDAKARPLHVALNDTAVLTTHPLGSSAFHTKFIPRVLAIGGWASFTLER